MAHRIRIITATTIGVLTLSLTACFGANVQAEGEPRVTGETFTETTGGSAPGNASCELGESEKFAVPDPDCTPGAITSAISPADPSPVCLTANAEEPAPADDVTERVLAAYGIATDKSEDYVIDYLVPRSVGGANDYANLWPIPINDSAHAQKDQVDQQVADAVCNGLAGIQAAQFLVAHDWPTALAKLNQAG